MFVRKDLKNKEYIYNIFVLLFFKGKELAAHGGSERII